MELDEILIKLQMKQDLKKAKAMHPYKVYHTEKSGYYTTVDDPTCTSGKRKIRRSTEKSLWDALIEWYIYNNT